MPTFETSQEWLQQSSLLLEARPTTTKITTRYSIKPVKLRERKKAAMEAAGQAILPKPPRGSIVIKTYDPVSGVALKYRTTKAAEVSRLIYSLGTLGRRMAALPVDTELTMADAPAPNSVSKGGSADTQGEVAHADAMISQSAGAQQPPQQTGGGGKKKKKGKK